MVARGRPGAVLELAPAGGVAVLEVRGGPVVVGVVAGREDLARDVATSAAVASSPFDAQSAMSPAPTSVAGEGSGVETAIVGRAEALEPGCRCPPARHSGTPLGCRWVAGSRLGGGADPEAPEADGPGADGATVGVATTARADPAGEADSPTTGSTRRTRAVAPTSRSRVATNTTAPSATCRRRSSRGGLVGPWTRSSGGPAGGSAGGSDGGSARGSDGAGSSSGGGGGTAPSVIARSLADAPIPGARSGHQRERSTR